LGGLGADPQEVQELRLLPGLVMWTAKFYWGGFKLHKAVAIAMTVRPGLH
jgi:hypothetical protein